jgi:CelD/BcsL family acetyltransferase involved in cellulose biosynthesis
MQLYLAAKTRHFRKRLSADCRQAKERFPDLRLREFRRGEIDQGMEILLELEKRSWKARGSRTRKFYIGPEPQLAAFHRETARAFAETDEALVLTMEVGERPVAGIHCLERDGVMTPIITFMDEEFSDDLTAAPMFRRMLESSIERGLKELDFNGKTANIAKWADRTRVSTRHFLYNRRLYSRLLRVLSRTAHGAYRAASAIPRRRKPAKSEHIGSESERE